MHWISVLISQTGSYFTAVALPWFVLSITDNNPLAMAKIFVCMLIPQSVFLVFGGALVDRFNAKAVLLLTRVINLVLLLILGSIIYFASASLATIYVFAFFVGLVAAIGIPAAQSVLPQIMDQAELGLGNGIIIATNHVAQIIGPVLAGWTLWFIHKKSDFLGATVGKQYATAFFVESVFLLIAVLITLKISSIKTSESKQNLFNLALEGLYFCFMNSQIRLVLIYVALMSFCLQGPLLTALPLFIKLELDLNELYYGLFLSMTGVGIVAGAALSVVVNPEPGKLGIYIILCDLVSGLLLLLFHHQKNPFLIAIFLSGIGVCSGFVAVSGTTWFQKITSEEFIGRVMAILMSCVVGLIPISSLLAGHLMRVYTPNDVLAIFGCIIVAAALIGICIPRVRNMGLVYGLN